MALKMENKPETGFSSRKNNILKQENAFQALAVVSGIAAFLLLLVLIFELQDEIPAEISKWFLPAAAVFTVLNLISALTAQYLRSQWFAIEKKEGRDALTGLLNRATFEKMLDEELRRGGRYHYSITLCYVKLDDFDSYLEHFGKIQGEAVLKKFADLLQANVRFADCTARFQADEFCILLPHTDIVRAEKFLSRIQAQTQERLDFGFCAGVTSYQAGETKAQFIMRALSALDQAKREGRKKIRYVVGDNPTTVSF